MANAPFQPIPEATQPWVDRLLGSQVGEHRVTERVGEGRYGTLYRCQHATSGQPATLEVLRAGLTGNDEEVRALNAIRCAGIVTVSAFGQVADGRRYRLMEPLEGESLERKGRLPPRETAQLLAAIAGVLEAAHAWAIAHGCLGASSVFVSGGAVKVLDFGLSKQPVTPAHDLRALGVLGFTLLTGQEVEERALPPLSPAIPELLGRVLRELVEDRLKSATEARKELMGLEGQLEPAAPAAPPPARRSRALPIAAAAAALAAIAGVVAIVAWSSTPEENAPVAEEYDDSFEDSPSRLSDDELSDDEAADTVETSEPTEPTAPRPIHKSTRSVRRVPSAKALSEQISRLEAQLRKEARPGDDIDQALFMLNKQRLRLTGAPTEADRRDVARQLAGWRRSYLRR